MADWQTKGDTRNPLDVLIERERYSCNGCRFRIVDMCFGKTVEACRLGRKKARKCSMYAEKE